MDKLMRKSVERFVNGDDSCFPDVYKYYKNRINYLAISILHNDADAEEVVQDTFIKIIESRSTLHDDTAFNSWVYRIAYNKSLDIYRKNKKYADTKEEFAVDSIASGEEQSTDNIMRKKELLKQIQLSIDNLPDKQKQMATLRFIGELSLDEISEIMGIPTGTLKSGLHRIKKTLKQDLTRKKITPMNYLALSINPLTMKLFIDIVKQQSLSASSQEMIAIGIKRATGVSALGGASAISGGISLMTSAIVISGSLIVGGGVYFGVDQIINTSDSTVTQQTFSNFEGFEYKPEMTNENLQIAVNFDREIEAEQVSVTCSGQKIEVSNANHKQLSFIATQNGEYILNYRGQNYYIAIQNIDKELPQLLTMIEENGKLRVNTADNLSGVDFEKSYFESEGRQTAFEMIDDSNAILVSAINQDGIIMLFDKAGNYAIFNVEIKNG